MLIIGVDNGNYNTKSSEGMIYTSGFTASDAPTLSIDNQLEYRGKYYAIGTNRMNVQHDKTVDDDVFILTLPAIAHAMKKSGLYESEIVLGVGLPISLLGAQRERFRKYFIRENIEFTWAGEDFYIDITDCKVFGQGYAMFGAYYSVVKQYGTVTIIDIGGYTVDIVTLNKNNPENLFHRSLPMGTIIHFNNIKNELLKSNIILSDEQITAAFFGLVEHLEKPLIEETIATLSRRYVKSLYNSIGEMGIDLKSPVALAGGGAEVMSKYLKSKDIYCVAVFDKFANADGYKIRVR